MAFVGGVAGQIAFRSNQTVNNLLNGRPFNAGVDDPLTSAISFGAGAFFGGMEYFNTRAVSNTRAVNPLVSEELPDGVLGGGGGGNPDAPIEFSGRDSSDPVDLYRAVSPEEYQDIMKTGSFRPRPDGKSMDYKQFGLNPEETIKFSERYPDTAAIIRSKNTSRCF